ncbi:YpiF family protein [Bacillus sp. DJP31]|uniref:YpiF family protein n=1 Tax=Bacillus sp. DJP31 TaxID=3409789 RepID=UPI003BB7D59B
MTTDMDLYLQSKEYVDTAIIPLLSISLDQQLKNTVLNGEFIEKVGSEIERQFKGRMFLLPSFTYLNSKLESEFIRLMEWKEHLVGQGFKHILFLTSEAEWQQYSEKLGESLIWLQAIPLEHLDSHIKQQIMTDQVQHLVPLILAAWRG